ncbi:ubiquitin-binding SDF ubiquitin ligase complex subunit met30 [Linderina pennispora]|nr:ubiquitin-binding SDF ubiquitin ligase complex subunit met30 [Linderina pennispora]
MSSTLSTFSPASTDYIAADAQQHIRADSHADTAATTTAAGQGGSERDGSASPSSTAGRKRNFAEFVSGSSVRELDLLALRRYPAFGGKCYRHSTQVYLAECDNTQRQLQASLRALPSAEQEKISGIWSNFASEPAERRLLILQGIVNLCCIPQLSYLNKVVPQQLRVDFLAAAPPDVSLKILSYLDAQSLCQAAQVSRTWASLANDDILWHRMCAQHIDKVCKKCGWGLPLLDKSSRRVYEATARRAMRLASSSAIDVRGHNKALRIAASSTNGAATPANGKFNPNYTFALPTNNVAIEPASQILSYQPAGESSSSPSQSERQQMIPVSSLINSSDLDVSLVSSVCAPQNTIEFMQGPQALADGGGSSNSTGSQPLGSIPRRAAFVHEPADSESGNVSDCSSTNDCSTSRSGSMRHKRRPWKEIFAERQIIANNWRRFRYQESRIQAHTDGILCVQFNDEYVITGSYDSKVRVWDAETFEMVSELSGHTMPVRALEFDECKLFSGSLDGTVRIWNYRDGTCIRTLRVFENGGVISLHYSGGTLVAGGENGTIRVYNIAKMTSFTLTGHTDWVNSVKLYGDSTLFSCSDDMLVKRWDLDQRRCVRTYTGHSHHVQSLQLSTRMPSSLQAQQSSMARLGSRAPEPVSERPFLITGSLDSTMRVWDIETGECLDTIFGHVEGIWSMTFDSLRIVSGSNDGTVKIWDTSSHACLHTLLASAAAVNCVAISDTRFIIGDNDGSVGVYDFRDHPQYSH